MCVFECLAITFFFLIFLLLSFVFLLCQFFSLLFMCNPLLLTQTATTHANDAVKVTWSRTETFGTLPLQQRQKKKYFGEPNPPRWGAGVANGRRPVRVIASFRSAIYLQLLIFLTVSMQAGKRRDTGKAWGGGPLEVYEWKRSMDMLRCKSIRSDVWIEEM